MTLFIDQTGQIKGTIGTMKEELPIDPSSLGSSTIKRQGVITTIDGKWFADMFLCGGPVIGPFSSRAETTQAEISWLHANRF